MDCVRHFVLFFESYEISWVKPCSKQSLLFCVALTASLIRARFLATGSGFDFGFFAMCILISWYILMVIDPSSSKVRGQGASGKEVTQGSPTPRWIPFLVLFVSFGYAFLGPILGIQHMGAPTMYSNMRYYYGGNHLLVPTSVLPPEVIYGGGLAQVVSSTSSSLNQRLAYIRNKDVFPSRPLAYMDDALSNRDVYQLFPLCVSNPHSRAVLQDVYNSSNPDGSTSRYSFILPVSEIRKALSEASMTEKSYSIVVTDATTGEMCQEDPSLLLSIDSHRGCHIQLSDGSTSPASCTETKFGKLLLETEEPQVYGKNAWQSLLLSMAKGVRHKLLTPYPQLVGWPEEPCMS